MSEDKTTHFGYKQVPAGEKANIESQVKDLRKTAEGEDINAIKRQSEDRDFTAMTATPALAALTWVPRRWKPQAPSVSNVSNKIYREFIRRTPLIKTA